MSSPASAPAEEEKPKRRGKGTGTLTEISPRVWRLRAPGGIDKGTKRTRQISRTFRASKPANRGGKGEALAALRKLCAEVDEGRHVGSSATFAKLTEQYLEHVKRTKGAGTYDSYRAKLNGAVAEEIG